MSFNGSPLGPILRAIVSGIWSHLFDSAPSNELYLPRIIRDGYPPWDLPAYDPTTSDGLNQPLTISGVPQDVSDSACTNDFPISPIATSDPALLLNNLLLSNLSQMSKVSLTFSTTDPVVVATVSVGTETLPFTLARNDASKSNFYFQVACCEPIDPESRQCGPQKWNADAQGDFVAKAWDVQLALTIQLNVPDKGPLSISILSIDVTSDVKKVALTFEVDNLPKWAQQMAQIAVNSGVGSGAIVRGLQTFLNQPNVRKNIETLINKQLESIPDLKMRRNADGTLV